MKDSGLKGQSKALQIFQNFGFLTMGKVLGDVFTFLLFVVLSRVFGQEGIGQYSFAIALTGFFAVFADFGLYNLSVKEMSRHTDVLGEYYGRVFSLRLILSVTVLLVLLFVLLFLPFPRETRLIITLIGAFQVIYTLVDGLAAVFVAREDMHLAGLLEFSLRMVTALAGIAVVMAGASLVMALAMFPAVTCVYVLVAYGIVARKYGSPRLAMSWSYLTRTLREAMPYALEFLLYQLSARVDVVSLGFFLGTATAGVYNVAYRVVFFFMILANFTGLAVFPLASRLYVTSRKELETLYHKSLNLIILVALPAASGIWLVAPDLIKLIFGEAFAESAMVLRYLAWLIFLAFLRSLIGTFLTACDRQVERTKSQWVVTCVAILANVFLIPTIGIKGAAIATLISETLLVILFAVRLRRVLGWPQIGSRLAMSGVATVSFCLPLAFFSSLPLVVVILAAIPLYVGTLLLFKDIRRNEAHETIGLLKSKFESTRFTGQEVS